MMLSKISMLFPKLLRKPKPGTRLSSGFGGKEDWLNIQQVKERKEKTPINSLGFGKIFTDHMLTMKWTKKTGWEKPEIKPHGDLVIDPAATVLQYSQTIFEGAKAVRGVDGKIRMFRPKHNMARMNMSAARACLPQFDQKMVLEAIRKLVLIDQDWVPDCEMTSLYIRPTMIGTEPCFGVRAAEEVLLFVILSPVGPYFKEFKPITLDCSLDFVRAWPGGTGYTKMGANYASNLYPMEVAKSRNCDMNAWMFGADHKMTESGATNIFFLMETASGVKELVTPPLDGLILPGVTRQSIIEMAPTHSLKVVERPMPMDEILCALEEGRLLEMFATGTAASVIPVGLLLYKGEWCQVPAPWDGVAAGFLREIQDIYSGRVVSDWAVELEEWRLEKDEDVPDYMDQLTHLK